MNTPELLNVIALYLDTSSLISMIKVNRDFYESINTSTFWKQRLIKCIPYNRWDELPFNESLKTHVMVDKFDRYQYLHGLNDIVLVSTVRTFYCFYYRRDPNWHLLGRCTPYVEYCTDLFADDDLDFFKYHSMHMYTHSKYVLPEDVVNFLKMHMWLMKPKILKYVLEQYKISENYIEISKECAREVAEDFDDNAVISKGFKYNNITDGYLYFHKNYVRSDIFQKIL